MSIAIHNERIIHKQTRTHSLCPGRMQELKEKRKRYGII
jgi:hypothetical protein